MRKLIGVLALAAAPALAAAAEKPDWAFPVTDKVQPPPRFEAGRVRPAPPGSTLSITRAKADDMYDIPNWYPTSPAMQFPEIHCDHLRRPATQLIPMKSA
jgi:hypothetical protein